MNRKLNVLFVCTGNTCRSVLAKAFLEEMWETVSKEDKQVEVLSAGVSTIKGLRASEEALLVLRSYGIDFSGHRSNKITPDLVGQAQYIFTMTHGQKDYLLKHYPEAEEKVWLLKEYADGSSAEISDPFEEGLTAYRKAAVEIREALDKIVKRWDPIAGNDEKEQEKKE